MTQEEIKELIKEMELRVLAFERYRDLHKEVDTKHGYWDGKRSEAAFIVEKLTWILNNTNYPPRRSDANNMRTYLKREFVVQCLKKGMKIYTDNGFGGAPYKPLFYELWDGDKNLGNIHHATIKKLISDNIINSNKNESGTGKYSLKPSAE